MGTSPCAVIKMMGIVIPARGQRVLEIEAVGAGKADVEHQATGSVGADCVAKALGRGECLGVKSNRLQKIADRFAHRCVVIHDKNCGAGVRHERLRLGRSDMGLLRADGKRKLENGSATRTRPSPQPSLVGFNNRAADGKSDADAVRLGGEEGLKDLFRCGRINAGAASLRRRSEPERPFLSASGSPVLSVSRRSSRPCHSA